MPAPVTRRTFLGRALAVLCAPVALLAARRAPELRIRKRGQKGPSTLPTGTVRLRVDSDVGYFQGFPRYSYKVSSNGPLTPDELGDIVLWMNGKEYRYRHDVEKGKWIEWRA